MRPCVHYQRGACNRGAQCPYAHGSALAVCAYWQRGQCQRGAACQFRHGGVVDGGGGGGRQQQVAAGVCTFWQRGACTRGEGCPFVHEGAQPQPQPRGPEQLRQAPPRPQAPAARGSEQLRQDPPRPDAPLPPLCRFWEHGNCTAGDACRFRHGPTPVAWAAGHPCTAACVTWDCRGHHPNGRAAVCPSEQRGVRCTNALCMDLHPPDRHVCVAACTDADCEDVHPAERVAPAGARAYGVELRELLQETTRGNGAWVDVYTEVLAAWGAHRDCVRAAAKALRDAEVAPSFAHGELEGYRQAELAVHRTTLAHLTAQQTQFRAAIAATDALQTPFLRTSRARLSRECRRLGLRLSALGHRAAVLDAYHRSQFVVVVGQPGCGKSTQVPQYIMEELLAAQHTAHRHVVVAEPRKVAARTLAERVAREWGGPDTAAGGFVGYVVGGDRRQSHDTRILFTTQGRYLAHLKSLTREELGDIGAIVIDEAHERSIQCDILLGYAKALAKEHPHLRVVVASATIDAERFSEYFGGCPVVEMPGRNYPVTVEHALEDPDDWFTATWRHALALHRTTPVDTGDILCFLPSPDDAERARRDFEAAASAVHLKPSHVLALHGRQTPDEQAVLFAPAPAGHRKVMFTTSIAETSVTIDNVAYVVDSGRARVAVFDPVRHVTELCVQHISQSSAEQRRGRAGRTRAGRVYRCYTMDAYNMMEESQTCELLRSPLDLTIITLAGMGVGVDTFDWMERPDPLAVTAAQDRVAHYSAVDGTGEVTAFGRFASEQGIDLSIACLAWCGFARGFGPAAVDIAAVHTVGRFLFLRPHAAAAEADVAHAAVTTHDSDVIVAVQLLHEFRARTPPERTAFCRGAYVSYKALRSAELFASQLVDAIVDSGAFADVPQLEGPASERQVFQVLLDAFGRQMGCRGVHSAEYTCLASAVEFSLHASTAALKTRAQLLTQQGAGCLPEVVVYHQLVRARHRTCAAFVTPIPRTVLREELDPAAMARVDSFVHTQRVSRTLLVGSVVSAHLRAHAADVEAALAAAVGPHTALLAVSPRDENEHYLVAAQDAVDVAEGAVTRYVADVWAEAQRATLETTCGGYTRVLLGTGGEVRDVLTPDEFVSVVFSKVAAHGFSRDALLAAARAIGPVTAIRHARTSNNRISGVITYADRRHARSALAQLLEAPLFANASLFPSTPLVAEVDRRERSMRLAVEWSLGESLGHGYVHFRTPDDAQKGMRVLKREMNWSRQFKVSEDRQKPDKWAFLGKMRDEIDEEHVLLLLLKADVDPEDIQVMRAGSSKIADSALEAQGERMWHRLGGGDVKGVVSRKVTASKGRARMVITFEDIKQAEMGLKRLQARIGCMVPRTVRGGVVRIRPVYVEGVSVAVSTWHNVRIRDHVQSVLAVYDKLHAGVQGRVRMACHFFGGKGFLELSGFSKTNVSNAAKAVRRAVCGVSLATPQQIPVLFGLWGRRRLQALAKTHAVVVDFDLGILVGYGNEQAIAALRAEVAALVAEYEAAGLQEKQYRVPNVYARRELCAQLDARGVAEWRVSGVEVTVVADAGGAADVEKAVVALGAEVDDDADDEDVARLFRACGVCGMPSAGMHTLHACGHGFCTQCLGVMFLSVAAGGAKLPLQCPGEGCGGAFTARDLELCCTKQQLLVVAEVALGEFIQATPEYHRCPAANCSGVLHTPADTDLQHCACRTCGSSFCLRCSDSHGHAVPPHPSTPCRLQTVESHVQHITSHLMNIRCPKCNTVFYDFDGCFALPCRMPKCRAHICGWCLEVHPTDQAIHAHLIKCKENPTREFYGDIQAFQVKHQRRRRDDIQRYIACEVIETLRDDVVRVTNEHLREWNLQVTRE